MNMENQKSILDMARGAIQERTDYEMSRIIQNILDANTKATAPRTLTVTLKFTPDDDRKNIGVSCTAKSSLAATNPVATALYMTGEDIDGTPQIVEMVPNIPGQMNMDGGEQPCAPMLRVISA